MHKIPGYADLVRFLGLKRYILQISKLKSPDPHQHCGIWAFLGLHPSLLGKHKVLI
jgi:hypothetical protein